MTNNQHKVHKYCLKITLDRMSCQFQAHIAPVPELYTKGTWTHYHIRSNRSINLMIVKVIYPSSQTMPLRQNLTVFPIICIHVCQISTRLVHSDIANNALTMLIGRQKGIWEVKIMCSIWSLKTPNNPNFQARNYSIKIGQLNNNWQQYY